MDFLKNIDKKTLKVGIIGLSALVVLIIIISALVNLTDKTYSSYEEAEQKLVSAAGKYYEDNPGALPITEKNTSVVSANTLAIGGYISPLEDLLSDGENCTAQVVVSKVGGSYEYTPYLDCGAAYESLELYNKVLEDNVVVTEGIGLYADSGDKVFRGEVKNNYVMLNENLWRIVRIDSENNIVLVSEFRTDTKLWDDRYNDATGGTYGINNYNLSRVKESIETDYYGTELLTDSEKAKVITTKWCIGQRTLTEVGDYKTVECKTMSEEESPIGLLTVGEYMKASIDDGCKTLEDKNCTNYNYITNYENTFWSLTASPKSTSYAYYITTSGVYESKTNTSKKVRYVINLGPKSIYLSGTGTAEDPYKIK